MSEEEQGHFISEKAEAIERYLKAEPHEEVKALDGVFKVDEKYGIEHDSTLPIHLRNYLD